MSRASNNNAYIQRLLTYKGPVIPSVLKAIAAEVGITKGELDAIRLKVKLHFARGFQYMEAGYLNNAINELTQANALDPLNPEILYALANSYAQRYEQERVLADEQQALRTAKRCLELFPNDRETMALVDCLEGNTRTQHLSLQSRPGVFIVIGFFENLVNPQKVSQWTKTRLAVLQLFLQREVRWSTPLKWSWTAMTMVTGGVAAVGIYVMGVEQVPLVANAAPSVVNSVLDVSARATGLTEALEGSSRPAFLPGPNILVRFNYPGLVLEPRLSRLGKYKGEDYYRLHGILINDSGQTIRQLDLKLELLDSNDVEIATIDQATLRNGHVLPGGTYGFELFHKSTPTLFSVRVSVTDIDQVVERKSSQNSHGWVPLPWQKGH